MKAISIQQPWAWAILNSGKDVENRTWATNYRGPILIHTGKKFDKDGYQFISECLEIELPPINNFDLGGIVGMATVKRMVRSLRYSRWMFGPWGWVLSDAKPLEFLPCPGQLGLFEVDYPF